MFLGIYAEPIWKKRKPSRNKHAEQIIKQVNFWNTLKDNHSNKKLTFVYEKVICKLIVQLLSISPQSYFPTMLTIPDKIEEFSKVE